MITLTPVVSISRFQTLLLFSLMTCALISSMSCEKFCCHNSCENSAKSTTPTSPTTTTLSLDIQGMHCDGCAKAIVAEAMSIDGVSNAQVSLEKHSAQIQISGPEIAPKVESAIRSLGYSVTIIPVPH